jgi:CelD/BcsL family acetyltransferase involved in cellulose biosynthesis
MTAAARPAEGAFRTASAANTPLFARIAVFDSFAAAAPAWRALEAGDVLATAYQRFDFLDLWQRHIGEPDGIAPCIAVAFDANDKPVALLPLGRHVSHGLKVLGFLGGKHSNFNLGVWRRDVAAAVTEADVRPLLAALEGHGDALILYNQPMRWRDVANPLLLLPHHASPSMAYRGPLRPDFEELLKERTSNSTRYKMRKKVKALANKAGPVAFARADSSAAACRVVHEFFAQKSARMKAMGMEDVFGAADVRAFIEASVCAMLPNAQPVIEIYELTAGGATVATMGGMVRDGRFSAMFNSIPADKFRSESPGEQLLVNMIRTCCERGLDTFDLGVGEASYKDMFCPDEEPLFDTCLPLSARGHALVAIERAKSAVKRTIKQNKPLWSAVIRARQWRAALSRKS